MFHENPPSVFFKFYSTSRESKLCSDQKMFLVLNHLLRVAAAYLGALSATETSFVTQPFRTENCPRAATIN